MSLSFDGDVLTWYMRLNLSAEPALRCVEFWSTTSVIRSQFSDTISLNLQSDTCMHSAEVGGRVPWRTWSVRERVYVCVLDWPLPHADIPSHHRWAPDVAAGSATLRVKGRGNHVKFATHILVRWWDKERVRELELWKFTSQANKNYESLHVVRLEKTKGYIWEMIM